jgi:type II secretory pathway component PulF
MPEFECLVADASGRTASLTVAADDETAAIRSVTTGGRIPVMVRLAPPQRRSMGGSRKASAAVLEFTEMMDILTASGLSLKDSLEVAASIDGKSDSGKLARRLVESVRKGSGFAQAVDANPGFFSDIYRGLVSVGDKTGSVERIFPRLAVYLRDRKALSDKIAGAMAYPILVMAVAVFGTIGLGIFVMPKLSAIFAGFGGDASLKVQQNIRSIETLFTVIGVTVGTAIAGLIGLRSWAKRSAALALRLDRLKLGIPIIGKFMSSWETLNFAFAMETLTASGVPVEDAIEESARVVSNRAFKEALISVREDLLKGIGLSQAFPKHREFPQYLSQWMLVGEKSGKTERVFSQIRTYFQAEVDRKTGKLMTLIEPALIVLIGGFMVILILGIVLPLFSLYGTIL